MFINTGNFRSCYSNPPLEESQNQTLASVQNEVTHFQQWCFYGHSSYNPRFSRMSVNQNCITILHFEFISGNCRYLQVRWLLNSMNAGFWISTISDNTFHNAYPFSKILSSPIICYRPQNFSLVGELNWFIFLLFWFLIFSFTSRSFLIYKIKN